MSQPTYRSSRPYLVIVIDDCLSPSKRCVVVVLATGRKDHCTVAHRAAAALSHCRNEARASACERSASRWNARTFGASIRLKGERRHAHVGLAQSDDIGRHLFSRGAKSVLRVRVRPVGVRGGDAGYKTTTPNNVRALGPKSGSEDSIRIRK